MESGTISTGIVELFEEHICSQVECCHSSCGTQETCPGFHEFGRLPHEGS